MTYKKERLELIKIKIDSKEYEGEAKFEGTNTIYVTVYYAGKHLRGGKTFSRGDTNSMMMYCRALLRELVLKNLGIWKDWKK